MRHNAFFRASLLPAVLLLIPLASFAAPASKKSSSTKGTIEGTITVTGPARPLPAKPAASRYNYGSNQPAHVLPEEIVVYLEKVKGKFTPPKTHAALDQKYLQFTHRVLPVLAGTVVDFTNNDPVYHNVFSNSQANTKFDLGRKKAGEKISHKFTKPEDVKLYCEIHAAMKSHILVLQNPYFAVVEPGGKYSIANVPPGTYKLMVWHDYWAPVEKEVVVKKGKTAVADAVLDKAQF